MTMEHVTTHQYCLGQGLVVGVCARIGVVARWRVLRLAAVVVSRLLLGAIVVATSCCKWCRLAIRRWLLLEVRLWYCRRRGVLWCETPPGGYVMAMGVRVGGRRALRSTFSTSYPSTCSFSGACFLGMTWRLRPGACSLYSGPQGSPKRLRPSRPLVQPHKQKVHAIRYLNGGGQRSRQMGTCL